MQGNRIKNIELEASQLEFLNSLTSFRMTYYNRTSNCSSSQVEKGLKHYDDTDSYVVSYICVSTLSIQNNEVAKNGSENSSDTGPNWAPLLPQADSEATYPLASSYAVLQVIIMSMVIVLHI